MKVGDMVRVTRPSLINRVGDMGIVVKVLPADSWPQIPACEVHFQPCYTRTAGRPYRTIGETHLEKVVG